MTGQNGIVGRGVLTPKLTDAYATEEDIAKIRDETGISREYRDGELRHWLREAARRHTSYSHARLPWQAVINHAVGIEAAARKLLGLLNEPEAEVSLPTLGQFGSEQVLSGTREHLHLLLHHLQRSPEALNQSRTSRSSLKSIGPDCVLIGAHLPFIFRILYGDVRKGEGVAGARSRFVAACCEALGIPRPSEKTISDDRTRFRKYCQSLAGSYLEFFPDDGIDLFPPRDPSSACAERIRDWYDEISVAEEKVRAASGITYDDFFPPDGGKK